MKDPELKKDSHKKVLIKKCHICGHLNESTAEPERCVNCKKAFLPSQYFSKVHSKQQAERYNSVEELEQSKTPLVKGINVIW